MNHLEHLDEFNQALASYTVSEAGRAVLAGTTLVLCSAATATGRNTIIDKLVETGKYYFIVSDTTRHPRINDGVQEVDGDPYWFRTETGMLEDIKNGKFIEAEVIHQQQVSGMSIREIEKAKNQNKIAITDIDRGGVTIVRAAKPDTICLFFLPPDFESWQERISLRGNMSPVEYKRRMITAKQEFEEVLRTDYYQCVVNDNLDEAVVRCDAIIHGEHDDAYQAGAREIVADLLIKTDNVIQNLEG